MPVSILGRQCADCGAASWLKQSWSALSPPDSYRIEEEEGIKEFYKSSTLQGRIGNVSPLVKVPQLFLPKRFFVVVVVVVVSRTNFPLEEKEKKRLFCFFHRKEKKEDGSIPSSAFFG